MPHAAPTPTSTSRLPSLPLHSGLFITAFVCAHLAALGVAYAAAAIQAKGHELTANAPGHNAVHHLGRMTLVPVSTLPSATRR
ncbi:hypothetical protein [Acidovorax kalamii]|uniref:hypothetical protein n=1 Tax=Acidovorax kalamii TaxID=2004485 RepID=UPI0020915CD9|nr:hypothetical protein [Acidovorax kalamii]MCO5358111.1 hypothetical protein [Acidovorax kalamii]